MNIKACMLLVPVFLLSSTSCTKQEAEVKSAMAERETDVAAAVERALEIDGPEIVSPPTVSSSNGVLQYTLTAAPATVTVAGQTFVSNVYNGEYIAPVLRVDRGDEIRIDYVNNIDKADIEIDGPQSSNIHYHGMGISPNEPADNPYVSIPSSKADAAAAKKLAEQHGHDADLIKDSPMYEYRWRVPDDHPQGLYWFHPHAHGATQPQILSGMSSMLVVEGLLNEHYPLLADMDHRTLILKDIDLPGAPDDAPKTKTINGTVGGAFRMQPGEVEIWEVGNIGANAFFDIAIDGHKLWVLGRDGNVLTRPELAVNVFIPPSSRATIAVVAGAAGRYGVRSLEVDTGPAGDPNPSVQLATMVVEGVAIDGSAYVDRLRQPASKPESITPNVELLRKSPIARKRRLVYTESADGDTFYLNDEEYDMARIDFEATLGDVEEWTLVNNTDERHTFHIHQIDFLVTEINGDDEDASGLRDNIDIPYRDQVTNEPGVVKVILPFTDPNIVGKFLFHCHISEHSDSGMMKNMLIKPRPGA